MIAMPWRNQSRPSDAMKAPMSMPTICIGFILNRAARAYDISKLRRSRIGSAGEEVRPRSSSGEPFFTFTDHPAERVKTRTSEYHAGRKRVLSSVLSCPAITYIHLTIWCSPLKSLIFNLIQRKICTLLKLAPYWLSCSWCSSLQRDVLLPARSSPKKENRIIQ